MSTLYSHQQSFGNEQGLHGRSKHNILAKICMGLLLEKYLKYAKSVHTVGKSIKLLFWIIRAAHYPFIICNFRQTNFFQVVKVWRLSNHSFLSDDDNAKLAWDCLPLHWKKTYIEGKKALFVQEEICTYIEYATPQQALNVKITALEAFVGVKFWAQGKL